MSILDSYDNIPANYIPENTKVEGAYEELILTPPFPIKEGNKLVGYKWKKGEQFQFTYIPKIEYFVEEDAVILTVADAVPVTVGYLGQKAYNTADMKSFVYKAGYNGVGWQQQTKYLIPKDGTQRIEKEITTGGVLMPLVKVYTRNFRGEIIDEKTISYANSITISINEDMAKLFDFGTYTMEFVLIDNDKTTVLNNYKIYIV